MIACGFSDKCLPLPCFSIGNMARRLLAALILLVVLVPTVSGEERKFTLCIDAGHGGRDTGAPGTYSKEKDINLKTALAFGRYVERNCPDVRVVYTRKTDVFVPLYERAEIANRNKADLFVSVHTNALAGGHVARGFETYTLGDGRSHATKKNLEVAKRENSVILLEKDYRQHYVGFDPNSPESNIMFEFVQDKNLAKSIDFAKMLQKNVCSMANRPDKGVHQQNLAVLRLTSMPACLIELGYITTPDEERLLNDAGRMDLVSRGIYNAFAEYKNKYDRRFSVPYKTESAPLPDASAGQAEAVAGGVNDSPTATLQADTAAAPKSDTVPVQRKVEQQLPRSTRKASQASVRRRVKPTVRVETSSADVIGQPVFKIQILVSSRVLKADAPELKGLEGCTFFDEGGKHKYTYGASTDYNVVYRMRKDVIEKFPGAFIIAFKDGQKMDVNQAIREFKKNRNK